MTHSAPPPAGRVSGFTMLELVLAMLLLTMIIGMVFGTARTSLQLGVSVVETQNEEMLQQAFFDLLAGRFASLPGNARFDLSFEDSGTHYISDLTLQSVPMSFTWGGADLIAKAVQLSTVKRRSNYLDIVLRYYEEEILEDSESTFGSISPPGPFAEIVLLTDVRFFEWRVLDGRTMEWLYEWDLQGRLPLQVELVLAFGADGPEIRQVFWIPPRQNPELVMRQAMQGMMQPGQGGGGETPDDPQNPAITIPGRPGSGGGRPDARQLPPGVIPPTDD